LIDGTTQIGKSPAMPPPIWKKPTPAPSTARGSRRRAGHVLDARLHDAGAALAELHVRREDVAEGGVLVARHDDRQVRLGGGEQPALVGVALVQLRFGSFWISS
jgi:hypothetical protein